MSFLFNRAKHIHFIGIGGIGMSGIAEVLLKKGLKISGSDIKSSPTTKRLANLGATIFDQGHYASYVEGVDAVVVSSALSKENVEVVYARKMNIPVVHRAEMLGELMRGHYGVAIAGSHGKTTTTSLISTIVEDARLDPTLVVGGKLNCIDSNAKLGAGEYLIAEADESDGSFMHLDPILIAVTNIDTEHMEHYKTLDRLKDAFVDFINKIPFYGRAILCTDSKHLKSILPKLKRPYSSYGSDHNADYSYKNISSDGLTMSYTLLIHGEDRGEILLNMVGEHNILNSLAAFALADELGIAHDKIKKSLASFSGVQRRFTIRGVVNDITVVDDYGHHPTEIIATLKGAKIAAKGKVFAVFQPHRYTRLRDQFEGFSKAFEQADHLFMTPVYTAGEAPIAGIDSEHLLEKIQKTGHPDTRFFQNADELVSILEKEVKPNDMIITLGAGNVWEYGQELLDRLSAK